MTWHSFCRAEEEGKRTVRQRLVEVDPEDSRMYDVSRIICNVCGEYEWRKAAFDANGRTILHQAQEAKDYFLARGWTYDGWDDKCPTCSGGAKHD